MSFRDAVLAVLTAEGQTYDAPKRALPGHGKSEICTRLGELEKLGLAERQRVEPPVKRKNNYDYRYLQKVVWRRTP